MIWVLLICAFEAIAAKPIQNCGLSRIVRNGDRIVGGRSAIRGEFPWQSSLRYKPLFFPPTHLCGATILNERWLVTAAHCVDGRSKRSFDIVVGVNNLNEKNITRFLIDRIVVHEKFDLRTFMNDIALIRVQTPIPLRGDVTGVCLPSPGQNTKGFVTVSGWGATTDGGKGSSILQAVEIPLVPQEICQAVYGPEGFSKEAMLCAGVPQGGTDSCQGDSGGPLIQQERGRAVLVGVVSWGIGCALPGLPGVYTRVSNYIPWIHENVL
ncbi:trypsin-1-like [Uloborus diversus]|uniref:trypsin-1-like n=1 Tax=Uloborus diversus TaxID=327109 RepID=UPI0024096FFC|nr:trypsin-1-like [Uloborus diversus]